MNSIYTWRDKAVAERMWNLEARAKVYKHLYKLQVQECDIRHIGDLNFYTEIGTALKRGESVEFAISGYTSSEEFDDPIITGPRFEVLVKKATVVSLKKPKDD